MTFQVQKTDASGITLADPADPDLTVRFKFGKQQKVISGLSATNVVSEIIYNDLNTVTIGEESAVDAVSVRLRTSGAFESMARVSELLLSLAAQISTWNAEAVFKGFPPTTKPVIPAA